MKVRIRFHAFKMGSACRKQSQGARRLSLNIIVCPLYSILHNHPVEIFLAFVLYSHSHIEKKCKSFKLTTIHRANYYLVIKFFIRCNGEINVYSKNKGVGETNFVKVF